eukprot:g18490.t1
MALWIPSQISSPAPVTRIFRSLVGIMVFQASSENGSQDVAKIYGLGGYSQSSRVLLCMVGLPARGKSYITKMLMRYLAWSGFPVKAFNAGNVRRQTGNCSASAEFFSGSESATKMREQIADECMHEAIAWLRMHKSVCVAIFDATNTTTRRRQRIIDKCRQVTGITPVFVESICENKEKTRCATKNTRPNKQINYTLKLMNDDYRNMDPVKARLDFEYKSRYQTVTDQEDDGEICYVKLYNVGQKVEMHHCSGYLMSQIGFFLSNIHIQPRRLDRCIWLTRHAESEDQLSGILGSHSSDLTLNGRNYCRELASFLHRCRREMEESGHVESCGDFLVLMGTAPVHYSTLQSMIKSSSSSLCSEGDPSPSSAGVKARNGTSNDAPSMWVTTRVSMFCCCAQEKEEDFAVDVDDQGSKVIPSTSALGDASRTFEPDEKNFYTAILVRDSNGIIDMSLEKSDVDYVMIKDITQPAKSLQAPMPMPGQPVTLLCQRPIVRQLKFSKPAKLGMSTNFMPKDSVKPWIDAISEGSVKEWNQKRPEACVREHDRILSVNGFEDPPTAMVLQLLKEADVEITVLHYPE